jgi:hypothetical protein
MFNWKESITLIKKEDCKIAWRIEWKFIKK